MASLELNFNLRLNKKKSEILTGEDVEEIAGIKCMSSAKARRSPRLLTYSNFYEVFSASSK